MLPVNEETNGINTDQNCFPGSCPIAFADITGCCQTPARIRLGNSCSTFVGETTNSRNRTIQLFTGCFVYIICHSENSHRTKCICHGREHTCNKCQDIQCRNGFSTNKEQNQITYAGNNLCKCNCFFHTSFYFSKENRHQHHNTYHTTDGDH